MPPARPARGRQEYGAPNPELLQVLHERGALITRVPIYQWALPEDVEPLRQACRSWWTGAVDVVLLTTATQVTHLLQVAGQMGWRTACAPVSAGRWWRRSAHDVRNAAAGGIAIDMEPSHPRWASWCARPPNARGDLAQAPPRQGSAASIN
jgi:uroporphyrinogen-III synthase